MSRGTLVLPPLPETVVHVDCLQGSIQWKAIRDTRIGSSEAYKVLKIKPPWAPNEDVEEAYQDLIDDKIRAIKFTKHALPAAYYPPSKKQTRAMTYGSDHESDAMESFLMRFYPPLQYLRPGVFVGPGPTSCSSPDLIVQMPGEEDLGPSIVEIKCPASQNIPDELPEAYEIQLQHQMWVTGIPRGYLFYWTYKGTKVFSRVRDPDFEKRWTSAFNDFRDRVSAQFKADPLGH